MVIFYFARDKNDELNLSISLVTLPEAAGQKAREGTRKGNSTKRKEAGR